MPGRKVKFLITVLLPLLFASCGGGGGGSAPNTTTPVTTTPGTTTPGTTAPDTTAPVIKLSGASPVQIVLGTVYNDAGATALDDIDGDISSSLVVTSTVKTSVLGSYTVTYNVSDAAGNAAVAKVRTVNVVPIGTNTIAPVITLLGITPVQVEAGSVYNDAGATALDDIDGDISSSLVVTSAVNTSVPGSYTVTYNVSDAAGNAAVAMVRTVNVVDTIAPVISMLGSSPVQVQIGDTYNDAGATALDDIDGDISSSLVVTSTVNTSVPGSYTVTYNVSDAAGNAAVAMVRTVNVVDTTAPVISMLGSSPVQVQIGVTYNDAGATALDNADGNISSIIVSTSTVNTSVLGSYTVTYNVSDAAGNVATPVVRMVNVVNVVVDTTPPTVISTSPVASATSVALNSVITATFNEDIFAATVNGSSFTLADSGNITGTVSFDGINNVATFTPGSNLAGSTTYTATLSTAITDLNGNALVSSSIWSFTTVGRTWGTAELIETVGGGTADLAQVAVDGSGKAMAVWPQYVPAIPGNSIYANYFNGSSWGSAGLIETDNAGGATNAQVAMDASGHALAVWQQEPSLGAPVNIYANYFNGSIWGAAVPLEAGAGAAQLPQVAMDGTGKGVAVWHQNGAVHVDVWANHFDGSSWGTAELIDTNTAEDRSAQVAIATNGNALVVWEQFTGSRNRIVSSVYNGATWSAAQAIESVNTGQGVAPRVAMNGSGNGAAVWRHNDGTRYNIWGNHFNGSTWGTAVLLETSNTGDANPPQVAVSANGRAIAVWSQDDGTRTNIWANYFNGSSWGTAALVETDNTGAAIDPQIQMDGSGNGVAVWRQAVGAGGNIMSNYFNGSSWGTAKLVEANSPTTRNPQISLESNGNGFAVWTQGLTGDIWSNQFK